MHTNVNPSCVLSVVVKILNAESNQTEVFLNMLMEICVRDFHNDIIKPSDIGWLESIVHLFTHKLLISDSTLRSFITPQVRKMTPRLLQICGCDICITPKDMQIYLNIFRNNLVSELQHKSVGRHTRTISYRTKSVAQYKDKMFTDGECLHDVIKYAAQLISCTPIKAKNIINMKCALSFVMNVLSPLLLMKNSMMDQIIHWIISVFIPIKEDVKNIL